MLGLGISLVISAIEGIADVVQSFFTADDGVIKADTALYTADQTIK